MQNLKPKKHLGQHFLVDENIARKIVGALDAPAGSTVVEVGPGMGVLTKYLAERFEDLHLVEFDPEAVEYLGEAFSENDINIHHADFLKWDISQLEGPAHFIGNLPYNVSSPIFFHLLENHSMVESGVFMVQKEVADRICAAPGQSSKEKGILTILIDCFFESRMLFKVPPTVFRPPPKVMSAVFSIRKKEDPEADFQSIKTVVKAAFGKRRKTLRNALKDLEFDQAKIPVEWWDLRAEALDTDAFILFAQAFVKDPEAD